MKDKLKSLKIYAEKLQYRVGQPVPAKYANSSNEYKQMLAIDLKKTLAKIEELSR